jgi:hypothetical protein
VEGAKRRDETRRACVALHDDMIAHIHGGTTAGNVTPVCHSRVSDWCQLHGPGPTILAVMKSKNVFCTVRPLGLHSLPGVRLVTLHGLHRVSSIERVLNAK